MTADEYQQLTRELARRATMPDDAAARIEQELLRGGGTVSVRTPRPPIVRMLAAAAAILLAVSATAWYARRERVTVNNVTTPPSPVAVAPSSAVPPEVDPPTARIARNRTRVAPVRARPAIVHPAGFVPVPTAAVLPQFESGAIVRMMLPVAALPSYGIDISPASSGEPIEADVLVGQDGLARAIRLVNTSRSQQ